MQNLSENGLVQGSYISFVNLDLRTDRLRRMEQTLKNAGLPVIRQRGMLPSEYKGDLNRIKAMLARPQKGAIGCHFSQVSIMELALRLDRHAWVMEDDLVFCQDFAARMDIIKEFTDTHEWDVIWLGGTFHVNPPWWHKKDLGRDAELTDNPRMIRTYGAFCTYAYIVNRFSLPKVLNMLEQQLPTSIGIDYAFIQIQPVLKTFAFVPGAITQYDGQSDIGLGITRFSGFAKLGPYWYQDNMNNFDPSTFNWAEAGRK
jgi:GR25 family glycosyltransferase involved in LPS biosynthesis